MRAIDNRRLVQGPLSRLEAEQLNAVGRALIDVFDLPDEQPGVVLGTAA